VAANSPEARARAEAQFQKTQKLAHEGNQARAEYAAAARAIDHKTARLKKLRLEKEAADALDASATPAAGKAMRRQAARS
jgi:hypothetical protein